MGTLGLGSDTSAALDAGRALARVGADLGLVHVMVHLAEAPASGEANAFAAVLRADGPDAACDEARRLIEPIADIGCYTMRERHVKVRAVTWPLGGPSPGVCAMFGVRRHRDLDPKSFDTHWRDVHGPLAVRHHVGMWDYWQCTVEAAISEDSPDFDGFAIVQFPTRQDLHERFFDDDAGRAAISRDAASFVDTSTLVRVLMTEYVLLSTAGLPA